MDPSPKRDYRPLKTGITVGLIVGVLGFINEESFLFSWAICSLLGGLYLFNVYHPGKHTAIEVIYGWLAHFMLVFVISLLPIVPIVLSRIFIFGAK